MYNKCPPSLQTEHLRFALVFVRLSQDNEGKFQGNGQPLIHFNFIPCRRYIYICPRVHQILLLFIHYGSRKQGFKNRNGDGPFLKFENFYLDVANNFFILHTYMTSSCGIGIYAQIFTFVQNKFPMGLIFWTNWGPADPNENPPMYMIFEKSF